MITTALFFLSLFLFSKIVDFFQLKTVENTTFRTGFEDIKSEKKFYFWFCSKNFRFDRNM